jgi:xylan 1,4-beta-xylosidase
LERQNYKSESDRPWSGLKLLLFGETTTNFQTRMENLDARILSTDVAGGFEGTEIGSSSNGESSEKKAYFDWIEYVGM